MATIRDVAELSNASIATVSKVLNNKGSVSERTRAIVLDAAKQLNYYPNLNARHLKTGKSHTIGIITEDLTVFNAPEIVDGIAETCDAANYHYILGNLRLFKRFGHGPMDAKEVACRIHSTVDDMLSKQVDGIIYIGCHSHIVAPLSEHKNTKFVCAYCVSSNPAIPSFIYDEEKASYDLTRLLLSRGDTRIGMITGPADSTHTTNRNRGHMKALFDYSIPYDPSITVTGDWERDSGFKHAKTLIDAGVTAIFAHNDLMAVGVRDYCNAHKIVVGKDLRLIGFDNRDISSVGRPAISTVALPLYDIGKAAANAMLDILADHPAHEPIVKLDCSIVERESSRIPEE